MPSAIGSTSPLSDGTAVRISRSASWWRPTVRWRKPVGPTRPWGVVAERRLPGISPGHADAAGHAPPCGPPTGHRCSRPSVSNSCLTRPHLSSIPTSRSDPSSGPCLPVSATHTTQPHQGRLAGPDAIAQPTCPCQPTPASKSDTSPANRCGFTPTLTATRRQPAEARATHRRRAVECQLAARLACKFHACGTGRKLGPSKRRSGARIAPER